LQQHSNAVLERLWVAVHQSPLKEKTSNITVTITMTVLLVTNFNAKISCKSQ
jgi:hypothetical protein